jgi:hypothetical protein
MHGLWRWQVRGRRGLYDLPLRGKCSGCGDGQCDSSGAEDCATCPADCGDCSSCGDGKCTPPEDETSCPADCKAAICSDGQLRCKDNETLETCKNSTWSAESCDAVCKRDGMDHAVGCQNNQCVCGKHATYGEVCNAEIECAPGLQCFMFPTGKGFCTKPCGSGQTCEKIGLLTRPICDANVCKFRCDVPFLDPGCPANMGCSVGLVCEPNQ